MLLIQYLQYAAGGASSSSVFFGFFVFICGCNCWLVSLFNFFKIFVQYNIHLVGGTTKLFWLVLWVGDVAYSAKKLILYFSV